MDIGGQVVVRPVQAGDDRALSDIIRRVLAEFGANRPGFAWQDPELDAMSRAYAGDDRLYVVAERDGELLGGAGIGPLAGEEGTCELQKMYLLPSARGQGVGRALMVRLLQAARRRGYRRVYLETLTGMDAAQKLYLGFGFERLDRPLGQTGHGGCDRWFLLHLPD